MTARGRAILWLGACVLAVALAVAFLDRPWASYAALHHEWRAWAKPLTWIANPVEPLSGLGLVAYAFLAYGKPARSRAWDIVLACSVAGLLALVSVIVLKNLAGRTWPETWVENNPSWVRDHVFAFVPLHGGRGYGSFPSGHSARIMAPFAVLWHTVPRLRAVWALPPALVVTGLLACNFHWISDCLAGLFVGFAAASAAFVLVQPAVK